MTRRHVAAVARSSNTLYTEMQLFVLPLLFLSISEQQKEAASQFVFLTLPV